MSFELPMSEEAYWDMIEERTAPPYTTADAHRDWHRLNGPGACPWDACDPYADWEPGVSLRHAERDRAAREAQRMADARARDAALFGDAEPPF